jgi:hypothetical protein
LSRISAITSRPNAALAAVGAATQHAAHVSRLLVQGSRSEEILSALQQAQRALALDLLGNNLDIGPDGWPTVAWVNTYLEAQDDIPEAPGSIRKAELLSDPRRFVLYRPAALTPETQAQVDALHERIDHYLESLTEDQQRSRESLTIFFNEPHRGPPVLTRLWRAEAGIDSDWEHLNANQNQFLWYRDHLFNSSMSDFAYHHIAYPHGSGLPVSRAGVYLMARRSDAWTAVEESFFVGFRSFLLQIATAHLWGITLYLQREARRHSLVFELIQEPTRALARDVERLELHAREIRRLLEPPSSLFLNRLRAAADLFEAPPRHRVSLGPVEITTAHNAADFEDETEEIAFLSAVILLILGQRPDPALVSHPGQLPALVRYFFDRNGGRRLADVAPLVEALERACGLPRFLEQPWDPSVATPEERKRLFEVLKGICHRPLKGRGSFFDAALLRAILPIEWTGEPYAHPLELTGLASAREVIQAIQYFMVPHGERDHVDSNEFNCFLHEGYLHIWRRPYSSSYPPLQNPEHLVQTAQVAANGRVIASSSAVTNRLLSILLGSDDGGRSSTVEGDMVKTLLLFFGPEAIHKVHPGEETWTGTALHEDLTGPWAVLRPEAGGGFLAQSTPHTGVAIRVIALPMNTVPA